MFSNFKSWKESWSDLNVSVRETFQNHWLRILILSSFIIGLLIFSYNMDNTKENIENKKLLLHFAIEFSGVLFLFLLIEHGLDKLNSGISDPEKLPLDKIIKSIKEGKNELILYDIYLKTILNKKLTDFETSLKTALDNNSEFKVKILLFDPGTKESSDDIELRASQLAPDLKNKEEISKATSELKEEIEVTHEKLEASLKEICSSLKICNDRIDLRYYKEAPLFSMYYLDGMAYISFYQKGKLTTDSRQLYVPENTELGELVLKFFMTRFMNIWTDKSTTKKNLHK